MFNILDLKYIYYTNYTIHLCIIRLGRLDARRNESVAFDVVNYVKEAILWRVCQSVLDFVAVK